MNLFMKVRHLSLIAIGGYAVHELISFVHDVLMASMAESIGHHLITFMINFD